MTTGTATNHEAQELSPATIDDYPVNGRSLQRIMLVKPIAAINDIKANLDAFLNLKNSLLDPKTDIQVYKDKEGKETKRIKKSGCKKIATAFGLDVKPIKKEVTELPNGNLAVEYTVAAIAPNGRYVEGIGMCDTLESLYAARPANKRKLHDVFATAYTRAANRAVLDLVGGGEVSAEEISGDDGPVLPGRRPVPKAWLDKLTNLAKEMPDGLEALAEYVFEEIGAQYLSQEEIVRVADKLQKRKANMGKVEEHTPALAQAPAKDKAKEKAPAAPAGPKAAATAPAQAPTPATTLDPATRERMHRASWIEAATQVVTVSPFTKFIGITGEQFKNASLIIAAGRDLVELAEAAHIESFSDEARRRYSSQLKTHEQVLSAALHVLVEWCENHPAETIYPDTEIIDSGDAPADEEIDPVEMPF